MFSIYVPHRRPDYPLLGAFPVTADPALSGWHPFTPLPSNNCMQLVSVSLNYMHDWPENASRSLVFHHSAHSEVDQR